MRSVIAFSSESLSRTWIPVRVKKALQDKKRELGPDSIRTEKALARRQNHHDLTALEPGVLLDLGEFGNVGLHLVQ